MDNNCQTCGCQIGNGGVYVRVVKTNKARDGHICHRCYDDARQAYETFVHTYSRYDTWTYTNIWPNDRIRYGKDQRQHLENIISEADQPQRVTRKPAIMPTTRIRRRSAGRRAHKGDTSPRPG